MKICKLIIIWLFVSAISGCGIQKTLDMGSSSMEPTIMKGDKVTSEITISVPKLERFDMVIFRPPIAPDAFFVFRVIGLPNEHLQLSKDNHPIINGSPVIAPNGIMYIESAGDRKGGFTDIRLKDDEYFLVGDNVNIANDSRFIGPINELDIAGKVIKIQKQ